MLTTTRSQMARRLDTYTASVVRAWSGTFMSCLGQEIIADPHSVLLRSRIEAKMASQLDSRTTLHLRNYRADEDYESVKSAFADLCESASTMPRGEVIAQSTPVVPCDPSNPASKYAALVGIENNRLAFDPHKLVWMLRVLEPTSAALTRNMIALYQGRTVVGGLACVHWPYEFDLDNARKAIGARVRL